MAVKKTTTSKAKATKKSYKVAKPKNSTQYSQTEFYELVTNCCDFDNKRIGKDVYLAFADMCQKALKKGYKIPLPGIGKFQVRQTKARMGRNPATGEPIRIPAKKRIRLTPNKALKEAVL